MKRMRALVIIAALAVVAALMLFGCSSGSSSSSSSTASSSSSSSTAASSSSASSASSSASSASSAAASSLENGEYIVTFKTDSNMFHVNEANDGKGVLTVSDDGMVIHIALASKKIVNLYAGTADEAQANSANVIEPTVDTVTYKDGSSEEVYGFDVPVPALDEEFDVAILGEKGKWYDHKVSVTDPEKK